MTSVTSLPSSVFTAANTTIEAQTHAAAIQDLPTLPLGPPHTAHKLKPPHKISITTIISSLPSSFFIAANTTVEAQRHAPVKNYPSTITNERRLTSDYPRSRVGMNWEKYLVALGALKGMTTVLLVSAIGQARYLTYIARTHMMRPVNTTVAMMVATTIVGFFTSLDVLANSC